MAMTLEEVMDNLAAMGSETVKRIYLNHGAKEPLFGVKIGDMKKLVKDVKKAPGLPERLYATGNSDAMYLAGLTIDPKTADKAMLQEWAKAAYWYMPAETTVAGVAAESPHALELAREWIDSPEEMIAACGWAAYGFYLSITPDERIDLAEVRGLLDRAVRTLHGERNRVRYAMNGFVIAAGSYVPALTKEARRAAEAIGNVRVDMGGTACKVPAAAAYIDKVEQAGKLGAKRKTCIC